MKSHISLKKRLTAGLLSTIMVFMSIAPGAFAQGVTAELYFKDNNTLRKGCPGNVVVMLNTGGNNVLAADTTMQINTGEVIIDSLNIESALPMQTFNLITGGKLELSGARLPMTGEYNGNGAFGTIELTPSLSADTAQFDFSADLILENVVTDEFIDNVLDAATSKTFTIHDRYNTEVNGTGFCDPDNQGPTVTHIYPPNGADLDANVSFSIEDGRAGVDIDTLTYSIKGVGYSDTSSQTTVSEAGGVYLVETNPDADFSESEIIQVSVNVCDKNTVPSVNCTTKNYSFSTYSPPPPDPVCGDSIPTYSVGEQCDDGNTEDGDGCSSICLWEAPTGEPTPPAEPLECPVVEECAECEVCEETVIDEEEVAEEEEIHEAAFEYIVPDLPEEPIEGCTRAEVVSGIMDKFDIREKYADQSKACAENWDNCMAVFKLNSSHNVTQDSYYPDVFSSADGQRNLLEGDVTLTEQQKADLHLATEIGMIQGFYAEEGSPGKPNENTRRREIIKMLNWAALNQQWEYYDEYIASIGGEQNLNNVTAAAPDLYDWWETRYYNLSCNLGIIKCDPVVKQKPLEVCNPTWLNNTVASYYAYSKNQKITGTEDTDSDNVLDREETYIFMTDPDKEDTDNDGLNDGDEITLYQSNPLVVDTDNDGIDDGDEVKNYQTNPLRADSDDDGFTDSLEIELGTSPNDKTEFPTDANQNGIEDAWEISFGISSMGGSDDFDSDGLSNLMEYRHKTDPTRPDTDNDSLSDADEVLLYGTDPRVATNLDETGIRITNIKDGMTLTDLRPFVQGFAPLPDIEVEIILRNEFGHEIILGKTTVDENKAFVFETPFDLLDGDFYLLAKGLDPENKRIIESPLIRITLDSTLQVQEPVPERLANVTLTEDVLLEDVRVEIKDNKPQVIGQAGSGSRVTAVWQSVIGTSAVVADLTSGEFHIEAPHELAYGDHSVSVQAIRESDQAVSKLVTVNFEVQEPFMSILHGAAIGEEVIFPWYVWLTMLGLGIGIAVTAIRVKKKLPKKK